MGHFRTTFYDVDYIGTIIPGSADIVVLPNARDTINIVTCRSLADIDPGLSQATHLEVIEVNYGADPYENTNFDVIVALRDGEDPAIFDEDVDFNLTTDHLSVDFTVSSTLSGTIVSGTSSTQVTVTDVQMAPAGTNVTITAEHDVLFGGLTSVESDPFDVLVIPDLVITEIMNNPSAVYDSDGEWYEVYNNGPDPVDMSGWLMTDSVDNYHTIVVDSLIVPAYGFAVLGNNADDVTNGGYTCDYEYPGNFYLGNGSDKLILVLPGGSIEIDRVEWDNGATFPDPNGASMVYTGLKSEDNNDGSLWATSVLREDTYTGTEGDLGSPGTDGNDQIFLQGFGLNLKVFLEGPYDTGTDEMTSDLFIPYDQPFNIPGAIWEYGGTEAAPSIAGAVTTDWILVELRNGGVQGTGIVFPAFVEIDGQVCSYNGSRRLNIKDDIYDNLQIVIWQRNHIGIMSSTGFNPMNGNVYDYDFTTGSDKVVGGTTGYKQLKPDVWGMVAGDVTADGIVDDLDYDDGWYIEAGLSGYLGGDLNLDKQSNNQDKNDFWFINRNIYSTQVP